jgi:hypothetical protein
MKTNVPKNTIHSSIFVSDGIVALVAATVIIWHRVNMSATTDTCRVVKEREQNHFCTEETKQQMPSNDVYLWLGTLLTGMSLSRCNGVAR